MLQQFMLASKTAIVTGAAQGIGQAIALGYAQAGAKVAGVDINPQPQTAQMVKEAGGQYLEILADLSVFCDFDAVIEKTIAEYGQLDILVNNAGITRRAPLLEFTEEDWQTVIDVNQSAVFFNAQKAARQFVKQNTGGKIINIASVSAFEGGMKIPAYTAAKAAVKAITMSMSNEWAKLGINVNAIAPGFTITPLTQPMRGEADRVKEMMTRIPIGRWAEPQDMAGAAIYLASAASSYVSGATLVVDGGYLGR